MTVGISFTQEKSLEAIVVTDSRVSMSGRQSDSVNKVGEFSSENYNGVIFGAGIGNLIVGLITNLENIQADNLDTFVSKVHTDYKATVDKADQQFLDTHKAEIKKKASLISPDGEKETIEKKAEAYPEQEREHFIRHKMAEAQENYDNFVEKQIQEVMKSYDQVKSQSQTNFMLVAFDKEKGKIRQFYIDRSGHTEVFTNHIEIGSGSDGAGMYLASSLQGITPSSKLGTSDLLFYAINAYASSSMNQGVGGIPKVVRVGKNGNTALSNEQTTALVNLSGAFLSRFAEKKLTHKNTRQYISDIIKDKEGVYETVATAIGLTTDTLKTMATPYSAWQERSNRHFFNGKH